MAGQSISFVESALKIGCKYIGSERTRARIEAKCLSAGNTAKRKGIEFYNSRREVQEKGVRHVSSWSEALSTVKVAPWTRAKITISCQRAQ